MAVPSVSAVQSPIPSAHEDETSCVTCEDVQKVILVALEAFTYLGLVLFQGPTFGVCALLGFA
jgi:hypothetical protein